MQNYGHADRKRYFMIHKYIYNNIINFISITVILIELHDYLVYYPLKSICRFCYSDYVHSIMIARYKKRLNAIKFIIYIMRIYSKCHIPELDAPELLLPNTMACPFA